MVSIMALTWIFSDEKLKEANPPKSIENLSF